MWLINVRTFKVEEVWNASVKKYAILSHRWEDGEVSFQHMQNLDTASITKGFTKIKFSCEQALKDGYDYLWADTCCINKESTTELAEAINSMYRWYQTSAVCYVFLSDVEATASDGEMMSEQFGSSIWFTRGWTLQELLAPQSVVFYNQNWSFLGTKQTLETLLTLRTGIDKGILNGEPLHRRSVAQRMSWASARTTTRVEDIAYCLLGIFEVNMPMLYGEGERAFLRLQDEIIKNSDDHTIFAWPMQRGSRQSGLLASSAAAFKNCNSIRVMASRKGRLPFTLTSRGLSIKLMATPFTIDTYIVRLDCADELVPTNGRLIEAFRLGILLRRLNDDDQYARVTYEGRSTIQLESTYWDPSSYVTRPISRPIQQVEFKVPQRVSWSDDMARIDRVNGFRIVTEGLLKQSSTGKDLFWIGAEYWDAENRILSMKSGRCGVAGTIFLDGQTSLYQYIRLGFDFDYNPVCFIGMLSLLSKPQGSVVPRDPYVDALNPFEDMHLSKELNGAVNPLPTSLLSGKKGGIHWALRGDRLTGMNVQLRNFGDLKIIRGEFREKMVWDVSFQARSNV